MLCRTQKEAFSAVADRDDLGGERWKCADCPKVLTTLRAHNFAHVLPKGKYPELKCETSNILVKCYRCHSNNDHNLDVQDSDWLD